MALQWILPKLRYGYNPPAVYRFDFDNGCFYIGSSKKVKTRFTLWKTIFKHGKWSSKAMADRIQGATTVTVTILEIPELSQLKDRETHYLNLYFKDEKNINQSPNGHNNSGRKKLPEHSNKVTKPDPNRVEFHNFDFKIPVKQWRDEATGYWMIYSKEYIISAYGSSRAEAREMFSNIISDIIAQSTPS